MRFTERRVTRFTASRSARPGEADRLEREVRDMQYVVDRARQNQWFGGDVLAPEFAPVLSAIVAPRPLRYAALFQGRNGGTTGQSWREAARPS